MAQKKTDLHKRLKKLVKTLHMVRNRQAYVPVRVENPRFLRVRHNANS